MAKAIYVCSRREPLGPKDKERLGRICKALTPDNLTTAVSHSVVTDGHTGYAVMNQQLSNVEKDNSLLLGYLYAGKERWYEPLSGPPDGSFAIFRCNDDYFEAVSDPVASRAIWYFFDDKYFIASTSQRAIIMFIGSFRFDDRVVPWMISAGSLGSELSWDSRIDRLQQDASVILDRNAWSISVRQKQPDFTVAKRSEREHEELLREAIDRTIVSLEGLDLSKWALPLSGGYDSRALLCWLVEKRLVTGGFRTFTWGLEESFAGGDNDAVIAKQVADALDVRHSFFKTDFSGESTETVVDRFLRLSEGQTDHVSQYMHGMSIWKELAEDGVEGIIKGDVYIGWVPVSSETQARFLVGCTLCSDYANLSGLIEKWEFAGQKLPEHLERTDESFMAWRDRLLYSFRIPVLYAAVADIKFSYMEQISPLMSRGILGRARELPDELRENKSLYAKIIKPLSPDIPYSWRLATGSKEEILRAGAVIELLKNAFRSEHAESLFPRGFLEWIESGLSETGKVKRMDSSSLKKTISRFIPRPVKETLLARGTVKPSLDGNLLAFRVYIIIKMHQILGEDSHRFGPS
jgi:hypothetical protein